MYFLTNQTFPNIARLVFTCILIRQVEKQVKLQVLLTEPTIHFIYVTAHEIGRHATLRGRPQTSLVVRHSHVGLLPLSLIQRLLGVHTQIKI